MIASVSGPVATLRLDGVVVEVGGVGLLVHATPRTLAGLRVGEPARLATSLVVREDSLTLFGFADDDERATFETLQTEYWVASLEALKAECAKRDVRVLEAVADGDANRQLEQGNNFLARKVDGNVKAVLDWRGALAFGAAFGVITSLFRRRGK